MKILLSWLQEFLDIDVTPEYIAKVLTGLGIEVEKMERIKPDFERVFVARVEMVEKHPDAERLVVARVFDGENSCQVVCGAPNCKAGMKTALAVPGAIIKDDEDKPWKIKKTKIRGVESFGMLCSGKELKISDDENGILEFSDHIQEGTDVGSLFSDVLYDVALTPNLGHAASIYGIARELAAALEKPLKTPNVENKDLFQEIASLKNAGLLPRIDDGDAYCCNFALIQGVAVAPSPLWMQKRLEISGFRPINNIVDITNYVLLELGQPLHAYDKNLLAGPSIAIRKAHEGEVFDGLDDNDYVLKATDLVIADEKGPISLAGILGGRRTSINDKTVDVFLEAAHFSPSVVRKTARRLGIFTESSRRFERGIDPEGVDRAFKRALELILTIAGGEVKNAIYSEVKKEFPMRKITLRVPRLNRVLGTLLSTSEVENFLARLNFTGLEIDQETLSIEVPSYRHDLQIEEDLYEEVLRLYGYDKITGIKGVTFSQTAIYDSPLFFFEKEARSAFLSEGLHEIITCDLVSPTSIEALDDPSLPKENAVPLKNAASIDQSVLRTSLLPCHLAWVKHNQERYQTDLQGFEIGKVYFKDGDGVGQKEVLGITLSGKTPPLHWEEKPRQVDFYDLKGMIERFLCRLGIDRVRFQKHELQFFHPGRQAAIFSDNRELLGALGELHPNALANFGTKQRVFFAELDIGALLTLAKKDRFMQEIPSYPGSERDWTLTLEEPFEIENVFRAIEYTSSLILEKVELLDIYRSDALGQGKKNATFRFYYRDSSKTLEQEVVDKEHTRILLHTLQRLGREINN